MLLNNYTQQQYKSHHIIIPQTQNEGALILGDLNAATDEQLIKKFNINTIITAACGLQHLKIPSQLTHIVFRLVDRKQQNIEMYFELSNQTIEENLKKGSVLVHCGAGISRSASLIIAYFMKKHSSTFKSAITQIRRIKPNICPNLGFELQLKNYQEKLGLLSQTTIPKSVKKTAKKPQLSATNTSNFIFDLPLNTNTKNNNSHNHQKSINRTFNRTFGPNKSMHKPEIKQSLYIQGKGTIERYEDSLKNNLQVYEPSKYNRKFRNQGWGFSSTVKKR